jgi:hypothetical protein
MQNSPNRTSPFAGFLIMCVLLFSTAIALNSPLLLIFSCLLMLITGVMALMGRFSDMAATVTPDDGAPQMSAIDEVQEMRQALNNLDDLEPIPERPSISYDYTPSPSSSYNPSDHVYTRQDYAEISRYARAQEPDTRPPAWRTGPEEFPLDALDKLGKPPRPPMPTHAVTAAENAECDYQNSGALVIDLGLLIYTSDSEKPAVYREAPVPDNASYAQPFAEVWFEEPLKGGTVRLMLLDPDGALRFVSEAAFDKNDAKGSGRHTVLSPTRLPIGDHLPVHLDGWSLRIEVRGKCVAKHTVNWYTPGSANALVDHMATDGELTVDLAALVEQVALTPLSLDELLGGQSSTPKQDTARE